MKERPIIFSTPMVQAIMQGRKTMTRRIIKPQPSSYYSELGYGLYNPTMIDRNGEEYPGNAIFGAYSSDGEWGIKCPYGQPGDRLWVRETHLQWSEMDCDQDIVYKTDSNYDHCYSDMIKLRKMGFPKDGIGNWKVVPSIHMPRTASRITIEITDVRVERLQDITEKDAIKEWVIPDKFTDHPKGVYHSAFIGLWESIYCTESWNTNPWVWVIEFKKI